MKAVTLLAACIWLFTSDAAAQSYSGTFTGVAEDGTRMTLTLTPSGTGSLEGVFRVGDSAYELDGEASNGLIIGIIDNEDVELYFALQLDEPQLTLVLMDFDADDEPDLTTARQVLLTRATGPGEDTSDRGAGETAGGGRETPGAPVEDGNAGGSISDGTPLGNQWARVLAGRKVTYMESYSSGSAGGYNIKLEYYFCSNGEFALYNNSLVSVDAGGASGSSGGTGWRKGSWKILTNGNYAGVELSFVEGEKPRYLLFRENGKTYFDRARVFVTNDNTLCR